jgi:DUF1680 family protein
MKAVRGYWDCAVTQRGYYATGGANSGEIWCPANDFASRLGAMTQEHCTQYNMIRLAEFLFRHTGDVVYADFIERSIYNSIFAQQHPATGMPAYYLPLEPGAKKNWGTPTQTFWCCHGSIVQAHTRYPEMAWFEDDSGVTLAQFIPSVATTRHGTITLEFDAQGGNSQQLKTYPTSPTTQPNTVVHHITPDCDGAEFEIKIRKPWWAKGVRCAMDGQESVPQERDGFLVFKRAWRGQKITMTFDKQIERIPMPGDDKLVAFMDGPVVLAGLCDGEIKIPASEPFRPIDARHWTFWRGHHISTTLDKNIRFIPLHEITDQPYTVYFSRTS